MTGASYTQDLPAEIPLGVLFGNADKKNPSISPDGKYYAYLADDANGVTNVFVKPIQFDTTADEPTLIDAEPQQVTHESHRPLRFYLWAKSLTPRRILYTQDSGGNENYHLHAVDFELDETHKVHNVVSRDVTPYESVAVMPQTIALSAKHPNAAFVYLNKRDERYHDAHKVDLVTGETELLAENPGDFGEWLVDADFRVVGGLVNVESDGSEELRVPVIDETGTTQWKTIVSWPYGERIEHLLVTKDGNGVYVKTTLAHTADGSASDTIRLVLLSLADGSVIEEVAHDKLCDVDTVSINDDTHTINYAVFNYLKPRVEIVDESIRADIEYLISISAGEFKLVSASGNNQTWMYSDGPDNASLKYYIFDRATKKHALLFDSRPDLSKYKLAKMDARVIKTSDGESMVVYVTLPHGVSAEKLPFVVNVHGGPWGRDRWGYDAEHQHFANRGYGCLSLNFRASNGYGKRWMNLGDRQWGVGTMQQDVTDAAEWLIKQGLADPDRIAIYGGSYGGYATLAGITFTPNLYACAVDIVGPSNLQSAMASFPPYWAAFKKTWVLRVGDCENDEEFNRKISPLFHVDKITTSLLIFQGANDPRVKKSESDQIAKKMFENKRDVEYIVYEDEGHGFLRAPNRIDFVWRTEHFLAKYLGGRAFPKDETLTVGNTAVEVGPATL